MKLYRTSRGVFVEENDNYYLVSGADWDDLICDTDLRAWARAAISKGASTSLDSAIVLVPIVSQELWAASVTYYRSRSDRMEESKPAGGGDFCDESTPPSGQNSFSKRLGDVWSGQGPLYGFAVTARGPCPNPN